MAKVKKAKMRGSKNSVKLLNRISTKLLAFVLVIFVASMVMLTSVASNFARNRLTDLSESNLLSMASEKGSSVNQFMDDQRAICMLIKEDPTIFNQASVYAANGSINAKAQASVVETLAAVYESTGEIYEKAFVTFGSEVYANHLGNSTLEDVSDKDYYQKTLENGSYFGVSTSEETGLPIYIISYAITNPNSGSFLGTANIFIDMAKVGHVILANEEYSITILDKQGMMISTNGDDKDLMTIVGNGEEMTAQGKGTMIVDLSTWGGSVNYLAFTVVGDFIVEVAMDYATITSAATEMARNLSFVSGFFIVLVVVILYIIIKLIVKPLMKATSDIDKVISDLNEGHGDLTAKLENKGKDEISVLVKGVNGLMDAMAGVISNVQSTTDTVATTSSVISDQVAKAELEVSNVSATMEEMSASSEETSASMSQVLEQINTVAGLVEDVNSQSEKQAKYADETVEKVRKIQEKTLVQKEEAQAHLDEVSEKLRVRIENAKHVKEISNLTDEILAITSQTNLLSLNASIEAARAGEAGRGFAVVADEIRQLADSSEEAANRIQEVTKSVIADVEALAAEAESVTEYMQVSTEKNLADSDFLAESYSKDIRQLADSMTSFQENSREIQTSMDTIKEAIDAVNVAAEETANGITNVATSTVELSNQLQEVVSRTAENLNESNALSEEINKFKVK